MDKKTSFYNHYVDYVDNTKIVFNKFFGSILVLEDSLANSLINNELYNLSDSDKDLLFDSGFIIDSNIDEKKHGYQLFEDGKLSTGDLIITIELTQACNFSCIYCYQNSYRKNTYITPEIIDELVCYAKKVITENKLRNIETVALRFIGGEPLLMSNTLIYSVDKFRRMTKSLNKRLSVSIDTNGFFLDEEIVKICNRITVPLTNREDHDNNRKTKNGDRTYKHIIDNLNALNNAFNENETFLSIRFNVNRENYIHLKELCITISETGIKKYDFQLVGTINYTYNKSVNVLSKNEFSKFYMDYLQFLFDENLPIKDFPYPKFSVCRAYIPYTVKITQNGMLAPCDACREPFSHISKLSENIERYFEVFKDYTNYNPYNDQQCQFCKDIGICGGKFFCEKKEDAPTVSHCDFLPYDLDEFLIFFCKNYSNKANLFEVSNIKAGGCD